MPSLRDGFTHMLRNNTFILREATKNLCDMAYVKYCKFIVSKAVCLLSYLVLFVTIIGEIAVFFLKTKGLAKVYKIYESVTEMPLAIATTECPSSKVSM